MKLQILSDLHLEFSGLKPEKTDADIIILAGDISLGVEGFEWAKKAFDKPVLYVAGNHEYYGDVTMATFQAQVDHCLQWSHVCFLDNAAACRGGVRFIGTTLWTDLTSRQCGTLANDEDCIVIDHCGDQKGMGASHFNTQEAQRLFERNKAWLKKQLASPYDGKTVVITHHAPSAKSIHPIYAGNPWNPCFSTPMDDLMGEGVDLWVHGHTHNNFDYHVNGTRVICNPRGYTSFGGKCENPEFDPALVVEV
ncbi:MAG: metallophosphoesterase [Mariprofundaceae bacterium]